jgi:hypothetical protein
MRFLNREEVECAALAEDESFEEDEDTVDAISSSGCDDADCCDCCCCFSRFFRLLDNPLLPVLLFVSETDENESCDIVFVLWSLDDDEAPRERRLLLFSPVPDLADV